MTRAPGAGKAAVRKAAGKAAVKRARAEAVRSESLANLHPEAGGDLADDGRRGAGGLHGIPATAGLGASPGGLPDHAGADVLPRREPGGCNVFDHRATRETVRPGARIDADDVDQF